jgi:hypothetical protein
VVTTYPSDGQGLDCNAGATGCGVPRNTDVELRFDRYLLPSTAIRQSLFVYSGAQSNAVFLEPKYDVIERVIDYRLPAGTKLTPNLVYTVELLSPGDAAANGFRAFDGAPLAPGPVPLTFAFRTGTQTAPAPKAQAVPTCADVLAIFRRPSPSVACAGSSCHSPPGRGGLDLSSKFGLVTTAVGRVASETAVGPRVDVPLENPGSPPGDTRTGVQMPVIDSGRPENSYLLYKLLRKPGNFGSAAQRCTSAYAVAFPPGQCLPPSSAESTRLREWFVTGQAMPLHEDPSLPDPHLQLADLRTIQNWIAGGAATDNCGP